jgi:hypothetical protein
MATAVHGGVNGETARSLYEASSGNKELLSCPAIKDSVVDGKTYIMQAVIDDDLNFVKKLLECGADVNKSGRYTNGTSIDMLNVTPLMIACSKKNYNMDIIRALCEHPNIEINKELNGASAMTYAARYGKADLITYLHEKGAPLRVVTRGIWENPFIYAVMFRNLDAIKVFIDIAVPSEVKGWLPSVVTYDYVDIEIIQNLIVKSGREDKENALAELDRLLADIQADNEPRTPNASDADSRLIERIEEIQRRIQAANQAGGNKRRKRKTGRKSKAKAKAKKTMRRQRG